MNESIDLTKILENCPKGFKLYSPLFGEVEFVKIRESTLPIIVLHNEVYLSFTKEGFYFNFNNTNAECLLFPSKDQRDWSKFEAYWFKKKKFDPKTLQPFDKVLVRDNDSENWMIQLFSHIIEGEVDYPYSCIINSYRYCIQYNDDTKHLVGTKDEPYNYYTYWKD